MNKFNSLLKADFYKIVLATLLIGVGAGGFSFILHHSVDFIASNLGTFESFKTSSCIYAVSLGLISYSLTKFIFSDTNGSGIPQVKLSLVALKGKMPKRMPVGKFFTTLFSLASGLSLGKEGPLVTISSAWGYLVSHLLNLNRQLTKILVSSGAAAGLAAAFNTPIAAVVFTIEEVLGELNTKYLGPIIVTSIIASVTSFKLLGGKSTFITLNYQFHIEWHLILYLILGLLMSLMGYCFSRLIIMLKNIKKDYFKNNDYYYIVFVFCIVGVCSQFSSEVLGDGTRTINQLLAGNEKKPLMFFTILFLMKLSLSATSYSTGLSGGLFMPVLFLGAVGGSAFGTFLINIGVTRIDVGAFALLGMTSLLVAVIRTPFTAFVMLFEMTRDYDLILPLMTSSIAAFWISSLIKPESVYESVAEYEGVHLPSSQERECLSDMDVSECMVKDVVYLDYYQNISHYKNNLDKEDFGGYPVLRGGRLSGIVNRNELLRKVETNKDLKVFEVMNNSVISIYPDQSLLIAMDKMKRFEIGRLPIVSRFNDRQLLGIITPADIVRYLGVKRD